MLCRGEYEIVICSYDILKMYLARLHKIPWEMVILDEMHCLKNPEAQLTKAVKAIKCKRKLGLTGTLMQNNEKELHCLVDTIAPGAIGSWAEFRMYYGDDIKYGRKKSAAPEAVKRSHQKEKELRKSCGHITSAERRRSIQHSKRLKRVTKWCSATSPHFKWLHTSEC